MAEFISNSAILSEIPPCIVLAAAVGASPIG